jgi:hypothetical protein
MHPTGEADIWARARVGGEPISWKEACRRVPELERYQEHVHVGNLVVKTGRSGLSKLLGLPNQALVNKVQIGDCRIGGVVKKVENPPDLSDTTLVNEIRTLGGQPGATFDVDSVTFPDTLTKLAPAGSPGVLVAGATSTFTDATADFVAAAVDDKDTVTVIIDGEDFELGIDAVVSPTQLEVRNPFQLASGAVAYTIQTPGTQVRFTKRILGDSFPEADYGNPVLAHEAGLLFSNGALFNRITIISDNNAVGLPLRPESIDGVSVDIFFEWTITF